MDPVVIASLTVLVLLVLIIVGLHVGVALGLMSFLGLWMVTSNFGIALKLLGNTPFRAVMDYVFGVVPMFVLMGMLANLSGASQELYDSANVLFRRLRGGLGIATVIANAIFAAITGVSIASAAVFSKIAIPQMDRLGYNRTFSLGTVAGSSVLGMLIPPSVLLIVYGILTEEAIGKLFVAGILPGILLSFALSLGIYIMVLIKPSLGGKRPTKEDFADGETDLLRALFRPWAFVVLIIVTLGGIWVGFFTPTEAGAIGAFGAFILVIVKGKLNPRALWNVLQETGYSTASIFLLLITAQMYSRMLTLSGLPAVVSDWASQLPVPPIVVILMFMFIFVVLGAFLDSTSILLVCIPLMQPVVELFHYDLIWFGIISVVTIEMGLLTPPFGMVVYAMKSAMGEEVTVEQIFYGSAPFLLIMVVTVALLIAFPQISTFLPSLM